ncbi:hypothetical protein [Rhizobium sp.]|uniref:hypothetical protein n=1 Tax=Rhizobium sp. TaxID=391 RepID=UPI002EFD8B1C
MAAKIGIVLAAILSAFLANAVNSRAADVNKSDIPVAYAFLMDGKEAIYGKVVCQLHVRCQLIDNRETGIQLSLIIDSKQYSTGKVSVHCDEPGCSFLTWKTSTRLEGAPSGQKARELDLYAGENDLVAMDLLQRTRTRIGRIAVLF